MYRTVLMLYLDSPRVRPAKSIFIEHDFKRWCCYVFHVPYRLIRLQICGYSIELGYVILKATIVIDIVLIRAKVVQVIDYRNVIVSFVGNIF